MKLYYYDHCPFSARVRMALHVNRIEATQVVLPADDERTIPALIGRHQVPVLVLDDGTPKVESLDIATCLARLAGSEFMELDDTATVERWLEPVVPLMQRLGYPRWTRIGLPEFATPGAYEHFRKKKTQAIGDFGEAVGDTTALAAEVSHHLRRLPNAVDLRAAGSRLRLSDIALASQLRSLSVVAAVEWPAPVRSYTETIAARTGVDTFFDRQI